MRVSISGYRPKYISGTTSGYTPKQSLSERLPDICSPIDLVDNPGLTEKKSS